MLLLSVNPKLPHQIHLKMKFSAIILGVFAVTGLAAPLNSADSDALVKRCNRPSCFRDTAYAIVKREPELEAFVAKAIEKRCNKASCYRDTAYAILKREPTAETVV